MAKIPNQKAEQIERQLQKVLEIVEECEEKYGDECTMDNNIASRINGNLDSIGAFVINSL